jgi:hypothetical protein
VRARRHHSNLKQRCVWNFPRDAFSVDRSQDGAANQNAASGSAPLQLLQKLKNATDFWCCSAVTGSTNSTISTSLVFQFEELTWPAIMKVMTLLKLECLIVSKENLKQRLPRILNRVYKGQAEMKHTNSCKKLPYLMAARAHSQYHKEHILSIMESIFSVSWRAYSSAMVRGKSHGESVLVFFSIKR